MNTYKTNSEVFIALLFEIFYSMNETNKDYNWLIRKLKHKLYLPYCNIILENEINREERDNIRFISKQE